MAGERDLAGGRRDAAATRRDLAAERRDVLAEAHEAGLPTGLLTAQSHDRSVRARSAAADDRREASLDRDTAFADRWASARDREYSSLDELTGAYVRGAGLLELEREIARSRRTGEPLVVAFIDVDGLKRTNDLHGHAAGDSALREVAAAFRARLRAHDLLVRFGGDEFVCVIAGLHLAEAAERLERVAAAIVEAPGHGSVSVGAVQLRDGELGHHVIARADAALYEQRRDQRRA